MPRGPGVREIFSSQSMGKKNIDKQEAKLQKELSTTDSNGQSQMKKFGGYKPKILGGEMDFLQIQDTTPEAGLPSLVSTNVEPEQDVPSMKPPSINHKPWVIGDKDVPMVLGTTDDNDDDDDDDDCDDDTADSNNNTEHQTMDSHIYNSIRSDYNSDIVTGSSISLSTSSDTSNLLPQNSQEVTQGITNPVLYEDDSIFVDESVMTNVFPESVADFRDYTINGVHRESQVAEEPEGVFIPAPDYDEEEKTLNFNSEDTDHSDGGGDDRKPRLVKPKVPIKVYEGADLSHYLSEDDLEQELGHRNDPKSRNTLGKKAKPGTQKPKHVFKQNASNKNKRKSIGNVPTTNSVRSFSYADSKFGTKGKTITKSLSASNLTDDSEIFLSVNSEQSSYESFLRSRHGENLPLESNNGVGGGSHEDPGDSSHLKYKDSTVWKKLTMRLKHRVSKSLGAKDQ